MSVPGYPLSNGVRAYYTDPAAVAGDGVSRGWVAPYNYSPFSLAHPSYLLPLPGTDGGGHNLKPPTYPATGFARSFPVRWGKSRGLLGSWLPPVPFTPRSLATLFAWFRGDLGVTLDGSGNVSAWADQSANLYNASQAVAASRPAYVANAGLGYVVGAAGSFLEVLGSPPLAQPFSVYAVLRPISATPGGNLFYLDSGFGGSVFAEQQNTTGFLVAVAGAGVTGPQLTAADHIAASTYDGAASRIAIDGGAPTIGNAGALGLGASLTLGNAVGGGAGFEGRIYEYVITGALTVAEDAALVAYLKARYTIP